MRENKQGVLKNKDYSPFSFLRRMRKEDLYLSAQKKLGFNKTIESRTRYVYRKVKWLCNCI